MFSSFTWDAGIDYMELLLGFSATIIISLILWAHNWINFVPHPSSTKGSGAGLESPAPNSVPGATDKRLGFASPRYLVVLHSN
jgi:hypothetical protein